MNAIELNAARITSLPLYNPLPSITPSLPIPAGIADTPSSIGRAEEASLKAFHHPQLSLPKNYHYMCDLISMHQGVERVVSRDIELFKEHSAQDRATLDRLEQEKNDAIRKYAQDTAARDTWSVWATVAQMMASGASIVSGVAIVSNAPLAAAVLIASGAIGLGNRVMQDTGGWQKIANWWSHSIDDQRKTAERLQMYTAYTSLGVGLAGGVFSLSNGALSAAAAEITKTTAASKLLSAIQYGGTTLNASFQLGRSFTDKRMSDLQEKMLRIDLQMENTRMDVSQQTLDAKNLIETDQAIATELQKAIAQSEIQDS